VLGIFRKEAINNIRTNQTESHQHLQWEKCKDNISKQMYKEAKFCKSTVVCGSFN
jgi:uracil DNA glycosylase